MPLITQGGEASSRSHSLNLSARVPQAGFYLRLSHLSLNIKKVLVMVIQNNHLKGKFQLSSHRNSPENSRQILIGTEGKVTLFWHKVKMKAH